MSENVASVEVSDSALSVQKPIDKYEKLSKWLNHNMKVKITDGRTLIGIFLCTDREQNIILGSCQEFINSTENTIEGSNARPLGLAMVPGHHILSIDVDDSYNNVS